MGWSSKYWGFLEKFLTSMQKLRWQWKKEQWMKMYLLLKKLGDVPSSHTNLAGGFQYFCLMFIPKIGEMFIQFDVRIFFRWVGSKTPTTLGPPKHPWKNEEILNPQCMGFCNPKKCSRNLGTLGRFLLGPIDVRGPPTRWGGWLLPEVERVGLFHHHKKKRHENKSTENYGKSEW